MSTTILDVSKYQGKIDWPILAASGSCSGVVVKATDGQTGVDSSFAANFDGANTVDLLLGTYHFAQPDETDGDAVKEATHYVRTVQAAAAHRERPAEPALASADEAKAGRPQGTAW